MPGGTAMSRSASYLTRRGGRMLKVLGWIVGIVFLIGLLVVFGIIDLIF